MPNAKGIQEEMCGMLIVFLIDAAPIASIIALASELTSPQKTRHLIYLIRE